MVIPRKVKLAVVIACLLVTISSDSLAENPPAIAREFRAAWVATVANIDWPSTAGLTVDAQKREMEQLLNVADRLNLNAIILQVRPAADAMYDSKREPWSEYLTGEMGKSPMPMYGPLSFAIEEAHRRGIEVHAWFNPYRARHKSSKGKPISDDHISRTQPELVREYDDYLWLDPGEPKGVEHSLAVIMDVVNRYDVDGVHLDDYFYPYPIKDADGNKVPFPDDASWEKRASSEVEISRDDWRRQNVDRLIEQIYTQVKKAKPWVKVGISPFGIWRPGHPESITGFDAYAELYADAKKWQQEGWVDYLTPQLYWKIESKGQSYPKLLEWWHQQNVKGRHLWPGNYASRLGADGDGRWETKELIDQIKVTREHAGAMGNVHFSMKTFTLDYGGINKDLAAVYQEPALVPACPWLDDSVPTLPEFNVKTANGTTVFDARSLGETTSFLAFQLKLDEKWMTEIHAAEERQYVLPFADAAFVTPISRTGIAGEPIKLEAN